MGFGLAKARSRQAEALSLYPYTQFLSQTQLCQVPLPDLEVVFQLPGQFLMLFLTLTETPTSGGL